jgi:hypothetical protein
MPLDPWLARLRHDLVKRALWPARDLLDAGAPPSAADAAALRAGLSEIVAGDGTPTTALDLWRSLRATAPPALTATALDAFEAVLRAAVAAVASAAPTAAAHEVLRLDPAFHDLARALDGD